MTVRAKTKITGTIPLTDKADVGGHGGGIKVRMQAPHDVEYRSVSRLDGFLMQLTENGRVVRLDKTDAAYRALVWRRLGLRGRPKAWAIIYGLIRWLPRRYISYVLYAAAADWLVLKNESLKLAIEALANNKFTVGEVQGVLSQLEARILANKLETNALRVIAWQHFGAVDVDVAEETARVRERARAREPGRGRGRANS